MDYLAAEVEAIAHILQAHRGQIGPTIDGVLSAAAGSSQRVDRDMVNLLHACLAALDGATSDLHSAARQLRSASGGGY